MRIVERAGGMVARLIEFNPNHDTHGKQPGDSEVEDDHGSQPVAESVRLFEFNHYHDQHGRFTSGQANAAAAVGFAATDETLIPSLAADALAKGESPTVLPEDVGATMDALASRSDHPDLTELKVEGTLKFGGDGLGIARKDMPQMPEKGGREAYMADLARRGIGIDRIDINPALLHPMQKEIDAPAAARIYQAIRDGGYRRSNKMTVSSDNFVLDGHHRWAAATAYSFQDPHFTIPIERVHLDHDGLLTDAHLFNASHGVPSKSFGEAVRLFEFNPNHDRHGRFTTGVAGPGGPVARFEDAEGVEHVVKGYSQSEVDALETWQTTFYGCRVTREKAEAGQAPDFVSAVEKSPLVHGPVYRGVETKGKNGMLSDAEAESLWRSRVGGTVDMSWASTSPNLRIASSFGRTVFEITGAKAHDISGASHFPRFKEAVAEPGKYRVTSVRPNPPTAGDSGGLIVGLTAIGG